MWVDDVAGDQLLVDHALALLGCVVHGAWSTLARGEAVVIRHKLLVRTGESGYSGAVPVNVRRVSVLLAAVMTGCGQGGSEDSAEASTSAAAASSGGGSTGSTGTGGAPTTSGEATSETGSSEPAATSSSGAEVVTTSGSTETSGTSEGGQTSSGEESTSTTDGACEPDAVLDAVSFNFIKAVDVEVPGVTAGYYNPAAGELVFLAASGQGVRLELDGTVIGEVEAPMVVAGGLDGAVYDPATDTALLIDGDCDVAEVDAVTLALIGVDAIDAVAFGVESCSGVALGPGGGLYVASMGTDEVVVVSRDLMDEVDRFDVKAAGISAIDGVAAIVGSENFLITSGVMPVAAIFSSTGEVVVPAAEIGGGTAPLVGGGALEEPDGLFGACVNGQVWLCAGAPSSECFKYAPEGGGGDVCGCLTGT